MVKMKATIKNMGSSKIDIFTYLTQRATIGRMINEGKIMRESKELKMIRA